jgi:glutamine kinase
VESAMGSFFSSKAKTLHFVRSRIGSARVPEFLHFSVKSWRTRRSELLGAIAGRLEGETVAVRSSSLSEDGLRSTSAGHFLSLLHVANRPEAVASAVDRVLSTYAGEPEDRIIVQEMVRDVEFSGVAANIEPETGAPYYLIQFESRTDRTDGVTGGMANPEELRILRREAMDDEPPPPAAGVLTLFRELELLFGAVPMIIEFACNRQGMHLLQVRRLPHLAKMVQETENQRRTIERELDRIGRFIERRKREDALLAGSNVVFGQMADWNPVELLGSFPKPLAVSLFQSLLSRSVWQQARASMGYRPIPGRDLLVVLAGRPYVDVRRSLNSFLPDGLSQATADSLVDGWLERLRRNPHFHDKVEFEIAQTNLDFLFDEDFRSRFGNLLLNWERRAYETSLRHLTRKAVSLKESASLPTALRSIQKLEILQSHVEKEDRHLQPVRLLRLMAECRRLGTLPFAVIARHAFIAESLFRSAIRAGIMNRSRLDLLKQSIRTISRRLHQDLRCAAAGSIDEQAVLRRYGHLRPSSFDITSRRYDQRPNLFADSEFAPWDAPQFELTSNERAGLLSVLTEAGLECGPEEMIEYARVAWSGREYAKFIWSRHLSEVLERIAAWGAEREVGREELSFLTVDEIVRWQQGANSKRAEVTRAKIGARRREDLSLARSIQAGPLVSEIRDLYVVSSGRSDPNFITTRSVEAPVSFVDSNMCLGASVRGRILCLEYADPGFDWLFSRGIAALVTRYGGANSHMAVRCSELQLPAAIGLGDPLFSRVARSKRAELRCGDRIVRPLHG